MRARLYRELETNVALRVEDGASADEFMVSGRGELHLAILIETMRREGYEFQVSRPEVITREIDGKTMEPIEQLVIDTREEYIGAVSENAGRRARRGWRTWSTTAQGNVRLEYDIPTRGLIGFRNAFLTLTRGNGAMASLLLGYEPWLGRSARRATASLVASEAGVARHLRPEQRAGARPDLHRAGHAGLRGHDRRAATRGQDDLVVNVCKEKKPTNIRSSTSDIAVRLSPPVELSLEQSLDFINDDELVEVTPQNIRLRKRLLTQHERARAREYEQAGAR